MQMYEIVAKEDDVTLCTRYATNAVEARAVRREIMDRYDITRNRTTVSKVEISLAKPDMISFMNTIYEQLDYDPERDKVR